MLTSFPLRFAVSNFTWRFLLQRALAVRKAESATLKYGSIIHHTSHSQGLPIRRKLLPSVTSGHANTPQSCQMSVVNPQCQLLVCRICCFLGGAAGASSEPSVALRDLLLAFLLPACHQVIVTGGETVVKATTVDKGTSCTQIPGHEPFWLGLCMLSRGKMRQSA